MKAICGYRHKGGHLAITIFNRDGQVSPFMSIAQFYIIKEVSAPGCISGLTF